MQDFVIRFLGRDISSATALSWALMMLTFGGFVIISQPNFDEPMTRVVGALAAWLCVSALMCIVRLLRWQLAYEAAAAAAEAARPKTRVPLEEAEVRRAFEHRFPASQIQASDDRHADAKCAPEVSAGSVCVICMELLECGDRYRKVTCGHGFHTKCIDAWWVFEGRRGVTKLSCPTCRVCACEVSLTSEEV